MLIGCVGVQVPPIAGPILTEIIGRGRDLDVWTPFTVGTLPFRHAACKLPPTLVEGHNKEAVAGEDPCVPPPFLSPPRWPPGAV